MLEQISPLWNVYLKCKQNNNPLVLATLVKTIGSSYKKAGAMMLIEKDRSTHGLISGGCLEADVAEHAMAVFKTGQATSLTYDLSDVSIFGLGAGCDGSIEVVLQLIQGDYLPFSALNPLPNMAQETTLLINSVRNENNKIGDYYLMQGGQLTESVTGFYNTNKHDINCIHYTPPPLIAVCGSGIDVLPLLTVLNLLQWHVYIIDHRLQRFHQKPQSPLNPIIKVEMTELSAGLSSHPFNAAIIMNHNLGRDAAYLKYFAQSDVPWMGLLGPVKRRDKVLNKAGLTLAEINQKLCAPIGLDIGGHMPENIAISIAAQLQQYFYKT